MRFRSESMMLFPKLEPPRLRDVSLDHAASNADDSTKRERMNGHEERERENERSTSID
jgi:hypothetical protein